MTASQPVQGRRTSKRLLGTVGEVMFTVGLILALFVGYQLIWTNILRGAGGGPGRLEGPAAVGGPGDRDARPTTGHGRRPRRPSSRRWAPRSGWSTSPDLRDKVWGLPLIQGVGPDQLAQGIGHYVGTAMPGEIGNFATAGHRATHGEPLRNIDQLEKGDQVIVETATELVHLRSWSESKIVSPSTCG